MFTFVHWYLYMAGGCFVTICAFVTIKGCRCIVGYPFVNTVILINWKFQNFINTFSARGLPSVFFNPLTIATFVQCDRPFWGIHFLFILTTHLLFLFPINASSQWVRHPYESLSARLPTTRCMPAHNFHGA